ncbi:MAG: hypothetical protein ABW044_08570 [Cellvibrio sp.]
MKKILLLAYLLVQSTYLFAAAYTPKSGDEIIAQWVAQKKPVLQNLQTASHLTPDDPSAIMALANTYLAQAAQPGQSRLYGLAQAALKPLIDKNIDDKNVWLAWAQVQQHQHNFIIAQQALGKVLQQDPVNENANLLSARIYIIQDNPIAARNACLKLLGSADLLTVTACSLEVNALLHPNELQNSYQQLANIVNRQGLPDDARASWLIQLLADLASRNNDNESASYWLEKKLQSASVNYLAQWADVQLSLNQPNKVLDYLALIVKNTPNIDDALLLRLALAEKTLGQNNQWQTQIAERVNLREQRQDKLHASDLAIYYLEIKPDSKHALYWANINISNTREYNDKKLLARAEKANQPTKGIQ